MKNNGTNIDPKRSALMARVRGKNTKPEMAVRRLAHALGYRFRLHRKDLPGQPDLVFPSRISVIFVHGCYWHRHPGCKRTTSPKTRASYWEEKFQQNVKRDKRTIDLLRQAGWHVLVIWECETFNPDTLSKSLRAFLQ